MALTTTSLVAAVGLFLVHRLPRPPDLDLNRTSRRTVPVMTTSRRRGQPARPADRPGRGRHAGGVRVVGGHHDPARHRGRPRWHRLVRLGHHGVLPRHDDRHRLRRRSGRPPRRRRPYVVGLVLFAVGLVVGGLAPAMPVLVAGRFVQGFGAGVVPAIGYVAIGRAFTEAERPRMFAILSTAWVVPGLVGPVLAERVSDVVGWRWVFLGLVPLVAVAGSMVVPAMMRIGPVARGGARRPRTVLAAPDGRGGAGRGGRRARRRQLHRVALAARARRRRWPARRPRTAGPPHTARHAARPARAAVRDPLAWAADVRLLRRRHVRPLRAAQRPRHVGVRRQRRGHAGDAGVDGRHVDPGPLDRAAPARRCFVRLAYLVLVPAIVRRGPRCAARPPAVLGDPRRLGVRRARHRARLRRPLAADAALRPGRTSTAPRPRRCSCSTTSASPSAPAPSASS